MVVHQVHPKRRVRPGDPRHPAHASPAGWMARRISLSCHPIKDSPRWRWLARCLQGRPIRMDWRHACMRAWEPSQIGAGLWQSGVHGYRQTDGIAYRGDRWPRSLNKTWVSSMHGWRMRSPMSADTSCVNTRAWACCRSAWNAANCHIGHIPALSPDG